MLIRSILFLALVPKTRIAGNVSGPLFLIILDYQKHFERKKVLLNDKLVLYGNKGVTSKFFFL